MSRMAKVHLDKDMVVYFVPALYCKDHCDLFNVDISVELEFKVNTADISWNEVFDLLQIDKNKIDFAVPQDWLDKRREQGDTDDYFWYYGGDNKIFGEPLSRKQVLIEFKRKIRLAIARKIEKLLFLQME